MATTLAPAETAITPLPINPPTIGRLKFMGVKGVYVLCRDCRRSEPVSFDVVALPDRTLFPNIVSVRSRL